MPSMHSPRGRGPSGDGRRFGSEAKDFPRNSNWESPFSRQLARRDLDLGSGLRIELWAPEGWSDIPQKPASSKLALFSRSRDATLVVSTGELLPPNTLEGIAGNPFVELLKMGATAPVATSLRVETEQGHSGHLVSAPMMIPGLFLGSLNPSPLPSFKHNAVIGVGARWFSFETQAWGSSLDFAKEAKAQMDLYLKVKVL